MPPVMTEGVLMNLPLVLSSPSVFSHSTGDRFTFTGKPNRAGSVKLPNRRGKATARAALQQCKVTRYRGTAALIPRPSATSESREPPKPRRPCATYYPLVREHQPIRGRNIHIHLKFDLRYSSSLFPKQPCFGGEKNVCHWNANWFCPLTRMFIKRNLQRGS